MTLLKLLSVLTKAYPASFLLQCTITEDLCVFSSDRLKCIWFLILKLRISGEGKSILNIKIICLFFFPLTTNYWTFFSNITVGIVAILSTTFILNHAVLMWRFWKGCHNFLIFNSCFGKHIYKEVEHWFP